MRLNFAGRLIIGWIVPLGLVMFAAAQPWTLSSVNAQDLRKLPTVATQGGALPTPLPLFPIDNWWNLDISNAPVDVNSANFITFIGGSGRSVHPDFGGEESPGSVNIYGIPYIVVDSTQPKRAVQFDYSDESDGVDHNTDTSFPFYPIPDEAITQAHWIEGGPPGNQNVGGDRHMLIVDKDNKYLYELFDLFYNGSQWTAGSGAFFDMKTNDRRPETWTSADAAGLAILPGLARYDEVYGSEPIQHAFRVTVQATNGYVFPASHAAGTNPSALPMGARLRLKPGKTITGPSATTAMLKIVAALKKYGLLVADNGSNMFISGTFDTRWDNDILNPALAQLKASDFEVIERGYNPPRVSINDVTVAEGNAGTSLATFTVSLSSPTTDTVNVNFSTTDNTASAGLGDYWSTGGMISFTPGQVTRPLSITINGDALFEPDETFLVLLTASSNNAVVLDRQGVGTITNDDAQAPIVVTGAASSPTESTATLNATVNPNGAATNGSFQYGLTFAYGSTTASTSLGSGIAATPLQAAVTDLACNTLYHFRAVATNSGGTTNGLDNTFTTGVCPPPPTVTTNAVSSITQTGATLNGTINPNGGATKRRFEYGLTASYGSTSPSLSIGNGGVGVSVNFVATGLACNTLYHYRAVGQNSGGTGNGGDLTFTTAACPPPGSGNISAAAARAIAMNSTAQDTLNTVRTEIWYKVQLFANRSYQFSAWTVGEDGASGVTPITVDLFSDAVGTVAATPTPTAVGTDLEGSPNLVAMFGQSNMFLPTSGGTYRIRVLGAPDVASTSVNLMLRETTLFSPWFFVTTSNQYDGFHEIHNNTSQAVQVTLRAFGTAGTQVGVTHTFAVPANATVAKSTKFDLAVTGDGTFGGTVLTHNGAFGAISANTTTLSAVTGLSFDSPFTSRSPAAIGLPIR